MRTVNGKKSYCFISINNYFILIYNTLNMLAELIDTRSNLFIK